MPSLIFSSRTPYPIHQEILMVVPLKYIHNSTVSHPVCGLHWPRPPSPLVWTGHWPPCLSVSALLLFIICFQRSSQGGIIKSDQVTPRTTLSWLSILLREQIKKQKQRGPEPPTPLLFSPPHPGLLQRPQTCQPCSRVRLWHLMGFALLENLVTSSLHGSPAGNLC